MLKNEYLKKNFESYTVTTKSIHLVTKWYNSGIHIPKTETYTYTIT